MKDSDYEDISSVFEVWGGSGDIDTEYERLKDTNSNSEQLMKSLILQDIVPYYKGEADYELVDLPSYQCQFLRGLRCALTIEKLELIDIWESNLPAFSLPDNPRDLFVWIKELFEEHQIFLTDYD